MSELALVLPREEQDTPGVPGMTLDYRLRWMDFDCYGRMQPAAVLDILQDVATLQAEQQGIGHDDMLKKGVFWAVIRSKYEVVHEPKHHEVVAVRTWPHSPSRFSFLRDFSIRNQQGELLIKATTEWVFMSMETRKFVRITDAYDGVMEFDDARAFPEKVRKVFDFDSSGIEPYVTTPAYTDIDYNGHVNNAKYANYVVDAFNPSSEGKLKTLQIDYRAEVRPNEPLRIYTKQEEDSVVFKGVRSDDAVAFLSRAEFALDS